METRTIYKLEKILGILGVIGLLLLSYSYAYSSIVRQETANYSSDSFMNDSGGYFDSSSFLYINYSKPKGFQAANTFWEVRYGLGNYTNFTLSNNCINQSPIQLRFDSYFTTALTPTTNTRYNLSCYNGTYWNSLVYNTSNYTSYSSGWGASQVNLMYDGIYTTGQYYNIYQFLPPADDMQRQATLWDEAMIWNVSTANITYCGGTVNNRTLSINYFDENSPSTFIANSLQLNANMTQSEFSNMSIPNNYSHSICLNPGDSYNYADLYLKFNTSFYSNNYYSINQYFTNATTTLNLYTINATTGVSTLKLTLRNQSSYDFLRGAYVALDRYYVGEGVWRNVQMDKSGDFGEAYFNIYERSVDYRLRFFDKNNYVFYTSPSMKFLCTSGLCEFSYVLNDAQTIDYNSNIIVTVSFDNSTKMVYANYNVPSGVNTNMLLQVIKAYNSTSLLCSDSELGNSGTLNCTTSTATGMSIVNVYADNTKIFSTYLDLGTVGLSDFVGDKEAGFWAFAMMCIVVGFGLFSPVGVIIAGIIGLIFIYWLGIFSFLTITGLIIAIFIGIVISLRVKQ
jgi:hypothetical protein